MDVKLNLELARNAFPDDEKMRVAYMLGLEKGYELREEQMPKWKKTLKGNGCWSGEIGVNPTKRLFEYEHYTIDADKLFKLLDKEE